MNNYETIIGIEVHTQLNTSHKIFSPSKNDVNAKPNTNIHPIDLALPGSLPRFNEEVLRKAIIVSNGLNMEITKKMHWDRKSYFYQDNPKGFQITQKETPLGTNGNIVLDNGKEIGITFMHMEEDTAKSFHVGEETLLDYNRCGVPLLEIVSDPDMRSAKEAREYLDKLREILLFVNASDCKMEEGSLRVDVNVSVRPYGQKEFNTKVEIKNLNSFANVEQAIENEIKNQTLQYNKGEKVIECTKRFNEDTRQNTIMRLKESVLDYRYIPEPDLPWITLTESYVDEVLEEMPLLPKEIKDILSNKASLSEKDQKVLMADLDMTIFYVEAIKSGFDPKKLFNYLTSNVNEVLNKERLSTPEIHLDINNFNKLEENLKSGRISSSHVKKIIPIMVMSGKDVEDIIKEEGLEQITDPSVILGFITEVLDGNQESIDLYKSGKDKAFGFMVGQIMKVSKGQANPKLINEILKEELEKR